MAKGKYKKKRLHKRQQTELQSIPHLSKEIVALLNGAGIHTLGDIDDKSDEQLLKIDGITENNIAAVSALRNQ